MSKNKMDAKELKQPDEFVSMGMKVLNWVAENRTVFFSVVGTILVLGVTVNVYQWWTERQAQASWTQFYEASSQQEEAKKIEMLNAFYQDAPRGEAKYQAAFSLFEYYQGKLSAPPKKEDKKEGKETPPGDDLAKALEWNQKALDFGGLKDFEKQLLLVSRSQLFVSSGKLDEAESALKEAEVLGGHVRGLVMLQLGRLQEKRGNVKEAKGFYERVYSEYSGTEYAKLARNYMRMLTGGLLQKG